MLNSTEMEEISNNIEMDCQKINEDYNLGKVEQYSSIESLRARNALIAAATTRIPRRSKELLSMTVREAEAAKKTDIENKEFYLIYVLQHKTNSTGDPATIVYNESEYKALCIYINCIRSKYTEDNNPDSPVFLSLSSGKSLSFSSTTNILNKYRSDSGKALSTRVARISRTTEQRKTDPSRNDISDFAKSLSHNVSTAERYYVSEDLEQAVINSVRRQIIVSVAIVNKTLYK